jgi:hypothetical protein
LTEGLHDRSRQADPLLSYRPTLAFVLQLSKPAENSQSSRRVWGSNRCVANLLNIGIVWLNAGDFKHPDASKLAN